MRDRIPNSLFVSVSHRYIWWMAEFQDGDGGDRPISEITAHKHIGTVGFGRTREVINKEKFDDQLPFFGAPGCARSWQGLGHYTEEPFFPF